MALQRPTDTGLTDLFAGPDGKGLAVLRQARIVLLRDQRAQDRSVVLIQDRPEPAAMRLGHAAPVPTQLAQPTPNRAFRDLKASGDGRLALVANFTRPQNTLAQIRRIGASHGRASRQPSSPPFQQIGASFIPFFHSQPALRRQEELFPSCVYYGRTERTRDRWGAFLARYRDEAAARSAAATKIHRVGGIPPHPRMVLLPPPNRT